MRISPISLLLSLATMAFTTPLCAQSFNIDMNIGIAGPWAGAPADSLAGAAGQTGHWVALGVGPGAINLRDIHDVVTTADIAIATSGGGGAFHDHPNLSGDHEKLLGDIQISTSGPVVVTFSQLLNGVYTVITYGQHPEFASQLDPQVSVANAVESPQILNGAFTGNSFTQGVTHARHHVQTSAGQIVITVHDTSINQGYLAGIQLVYHGAPAPVMYVDNTATGTGQGNSWTNACTRLDDALLVCEMSEGTAQTVWVANGTYVPSRTNDRGESFRVSDGVKVYGGFAGGETQLSERDPDANICTLSGNIGQPLLGADNSYHVVDLSNAGDTTLIDGFTIRNGWANGTGLADSGGGLLLSNSSARVRNCNINNNFALFGGGAWATNGAPQFQRCDFASNTSDGPGGGLRAISSTSLVAVHNCRFLGNEAGTDGGGVSTNNQNVWMANCVFSGNVAGGNGGAVCGSGADGDVRLYQCTVGYNDAGMAVGGVRADNGADGRIFNNIIWGNTDGEPGAVFNANYGVEVPGTVESHYNIIQGTTFAVNGNLGSNPQFIDADGLDNIFGTTDDDYHVGDASPAIDSGHNSQITLDVTDLDGDGVTLEAVPVDLDDHARRLDVPGVPDSGAGLAPITDRGAYELEPVTPCVADITGDDIVNIDDLLAVIGTWGPCPVPPAGCAANIINTGGSTNTVNIDDLLAVIGAWGACP